MDAAEEAAIEHDPDSVCAYCEDTGVCIDEDDNKWPCPYRCKPQPKTQEQ